MTNHNPTPEQRLINIFTPEELAGFSAPTEIRDAGAVSAALGGIGLGDMEVKGLPDEKEDGATKSPESDTSDSDFYDHAAKQLRIVKNLCQSVDPLPPPPPWTMDDLDLSSRKKAYDGYKNANLDPRFIVAPLNLDISKWHQLFTMLDMRLSYESDHLAKVALGDSIPTAPFTKPISWSACVFPGRVSSNVSHDLSKNKTNLLDQANALGVPLGSINYKNAHMHASTILMSYAIDKVRKRYIRKMRPVLLEGRHEDVGDFLDIPRWIAPYITFYGDNEVRLESISVSDDEVAGVSIPVYS